MRKSWFTNMIGLAWVVTVKHCTSSTVLLAKRRTAQCFEGKGLPFLDAGVSSWTLLVGSFLYWVGLVFRPVDCACVVRVSSCSLISSHKAANNVGRTIGLLTGLSGSCQLIYLY